MKRNKLAFGVGINDTDCVTQESASEGKRICPYYSRWRALLLRCYDSKMHDKHPSYRDCRVCDDWLVFSKFREWMKSQNWEGNSLDKDLLVRGNKLYSPETCLFIPQSLNAMINGNLTTGVHKEGDSHRSIIFIVGSGGRKKCRRKTKESVYGWRANIIYQNLCIISNNYDLSPKVEKMVEFYKFKLLKALALDYYDFDLWDCTSQGF